MRKRKIDNALFVLAKLLEEDNVTMLRLQEITGIKNWTTLSNAVKSLKELGFVEDEIVEGPPVRRIIRLTERGREAARCARRILELAGLM